MSNIELDDFDFGFSSVNLDEQHSNEIHQLSTESTKYKNKMEQLYKAIIPLLDNLAKDSDKNPYIHWPDRDIKIKEFKKKLETIIKGV